MLNKILLKNGHKFFVLVSLALSVVSLLRSLDFFLPLSLKDAENSFLIPDHSTRELLPVNFFAFSVVLQQLNNHVEAHFQSR